MATTRSPNIRTVLAAGESLAADLAEKLLQLLRERLVHPRTHVVALNDLNVRNARSPLMIKTTPEQTDTILRAAVAAEAAAKRSRARASI